MAAAVPIQFNISFPDDAITRMNRLMADGQLPEGEIVPSASWDYGVDLKWLKDMRRRFLEEFSWKHVEVQTNRLPHYLVEMEGFNLHFIHKRSSDPKAVPLLLLHGWPGSFLDFHKVMGPLSNSETPGVPSFHVVVPSLPGYGFSSQPLKKGWTIFDTARVFHALMTRVLGYTKYSAQGGDWGSYILRIIGTLYPQQAPLIHFNMFRCPPAGLLSYLSYLSYLPFPSVTAGVSTIIKKQACRFLLSNVERILYERSEEFGKTGRGYLAIQSTKPRTIGFALNDSPLGLLAYIGEKMYAWSDPSSLDPQDVLATVALYYLTGTFASSVLIYKDNVGIRDEMLSSTKWNPKCKVGFTAFPYEIGASPRAFIAACSNLVFYKERAQGGHFAALDNPEGLVSDIREMTSQHWYR